MQPVASILFQIVEQACTRWTASIMVRCVPVNLWLYSPRLFPLLFLFPLSPSALWSGPIQALGKLLHRSAAHLGAMQPKRRTVSSFYVFRALERAYNSISILMPTLNVSPIARVYIPHPCRGPIAHLDYHHKINIRESTN